MVKENEMNEFDFRIFLIEKGFSPSTYGTRSEHQMFQYTFEDEKLGAVNACINIQKGLMTSAISSKKGMFSVDKETPKSTEEADRYLSEFLK